ncbi:MAG: hypothetical protein EI684_06685 [Candidatus Viridilinea halotolerans]|uniref:Protein kinase domain-containing protein n=1 Tax=Candidatus Viridilinea halotolerans TaxID=2491704 RepID=A0A426U412_9CHLR|nr:MAG: hypothetical protein EI684_06685 [Candidatus Viridilinea halotolerans]
MQTSNQINPGTLIHGRYLVQRMVGRGGMGAVYAALDQRLGTTVALKQMLVTGPGTTSAFEREAHLLAGLRHPALPRVIDYFGDDSGQFLVMEFIPGTDLGKMLGSAGQPLPVDDVLNWADQALAALNYLHSQQPPIIHRDIKPQNITLTPKGEIVILDFGLAKGLVEGQQQAKSSLLAYTPAYAPLEQIQAVGTSPASDIYALAATLYHLLTGQRPPDVLQRVAARANGESDPLEAVDVLNPQVASALAQWLHQGLALDARHRYANGGVMHAALKAVVQGSATAMTGDTRAQVPPTAVIPPPPNVVAMPRPSGAPQAAWQNQPQPRPSPPPPPPPPPQGASPAWQNQQPSAARPLWPIILGSAVAGFFFLLVIVGGVFWLLGQREPTVGNGGGVGVGSTRTSTSIPTAGGDLSIDAPTPTTTPTPSSGFTPVQPPESIVPTNAPTPSGGTSASFGPLQWQIPVGVSASNFAEAGVDAAGNPTTFEPANAIDGDPSTAWRVPGDGFGEALFLEFATPIRIHEIQLIPGYAKIDPSDGTNRFYQNRRVRSVTMMFNEEEMEYFEFLDEPSYQAARLSRPIITDFLIIVIEDTYPQPSGPEGRDFTPISEVAVWGEALLP